MGNYVATNLSPLHHHIKQEMSTASWQKTCKKPFVTLQNASFFSPLVKNRRRECNMKTVQMFLYSSHSLIQWLAYIWAKLILFKNYSKCRIWILEFWHFPPIFVLLKLTCLVSLFDSKLQVFKNSPKWTIFGIFN